jgi:hypothetical protein
LVWEILETGEVDVRNGSEILNINAFRTIKGRPNCADKILSAGC